MRRSIFTLTLVLVSGVAFQATRAGDRPFPTEPQRPPKAEDVKQTPAKLKQFIATFFKAIQGREHQELSKLVDVPWATEGGLIYNRKVIEKMFLDESKRRPQEAIPIGIVKIVSYAEARKKMRDEERNLLDQVLDGEGWLVQVRRNGERITFLIGLRKAGYRVVGAWV